MLSPSRRKSSKTTEWLAFFYPITRLMYPFVAGRSRGNPRTVACVAVRFFVMHHHEPNSLTDFPPGHVVDALCPSALAAESLALDVRPFVGDLHAVIKCVPVVVLCVARIPHRKQHSLCLAFVVLNPTVAAIEATTHEVAPGYVVLYHDFVVKYTRVCVGSRPPKMNATRSSMPVRAMNGRDVLVETYFAIHVDVNLPGRVVILPSHTCSS